MIAPDIKEGTILVHSIGSGHDTFYQVVRRTEKTVNARQLCYKLADKVDVKRQTMEVLPIKDDFENVASVRLRLTETHREPGYRIGPEVRMQWWSVWDGKALNQFSS